MEKVGQVGMSDDESAAAIAGIVASPTDRHATKSEGRLVRVTGGSMEPTIQPGWVVLTQKHHGLIEAGQVVAIKSNNALIVHRVVVLGQIGKEETVVHCGDGPGTAGCCSATFVDAQIVAIVDPPGQDLVQLKDLQPALRRRFHLRRRLWRWRLSVMAIRARWRILIDLCR